jgi:hypothetical protein
MPGTTLRDEIVSHQMPEKLGDGIEGESIDLQFPLILPGFLWIGTRTFFSAGAHVTFFFIKPNL